MVWLVQQGAPRGVALGEASGHHQGCSEVRRSIVSTQSTGELRHLRRPPWPGLQIAGGDRKPPLRAQPALQPHRSAPPPEEGSSATYRSYLRLGTDDAIAASLFTSAQRHARIQGHKWTDLDAPLASRIVLLCEV